MIGFRRPRTTFQRKPLASGNVLIYRVLQGARRGGVQAKFEKPPTNDDEREAMAFI